MATNKYYEDLFKTIGQDLQKLLNSDDLYLQTAVFANLEKCYKLLRCNLVEYCQLINKLGKCYDQMIHPNKRHLIKNLLNNCIGRYLEIKHELVQFESSDYQYVDDIQRRKRSTKSDAEVQVPEYFRLERLPIILKQNEMIDKILYLKENPPRPEIDTEIIEITSHPVDGIDKKSINKKSVLLANQVEQINDEMIFKRPKPLRKKSLSQEQINFISAIRLIQRHERARVHRLHYNEEKEKVRINLDKAWLRHKEIPFDIKLKATKIIQRYWKNYQMRRHQFYRANQRGVAFGMLTPHYKKKINETYFEKLKNNRREIAKYAEKAMEDFKLRTRNRMEMENAEEMKDGIIDELHYYILKWYKVLEEANLPVYGIITWPNLESVIPSFEVMGVPENTPENILKQYKDYFKIIINTLPGKVLDTIGGSALITAGHWISPEMYAVCMEAILREQEKGLMKVKPISKKLTKEELKQKALEEKEAQEKERELQRKQLNELRKQGYVPEQSFFFDKIEKFEKEYQDDKWYLHNDLATNIGQMCLQEKISNDVSYELQRKLRQEADKLILNDLEKLKRANDIDLHIKTKVQRTKNPKRKKEKKLKNPKDPTQNRTSESLFEEFVLNGLIKKYEEQFFKNIEGEYSYINYDLNLESTFTLPKLGDIRQVIKDYCVLPLGNAYIHANTQLIRSVLISGPKSFTKKYIDTICTESGATLFYLNPLKVSNLYSKKMFLHLITKIAKLHQPAVIFIDGAEKPYYKKVPKPEKKFKPKFLASILTKLLKCFTSQDQVIIIGTTAEPYLAKGSQMVKMYSKIIPLIEPDFHEIVRYWDKNLMNIPGIDRFFPNHILGIATEGNTFELLDEIKNKVVTADRIIKLKYKPFNPQEINLLIPSLNVEVNTQWYLKNYPINDKRQEKLFKQKEERERLNEINGNSKNISRSSTRGSLKYSEIIQQKSMKPKLSIYENLLKENSIKYPYCYSDESSTDEN